MTKQVVQLEHPELPQAECRAIVVGKPWSHDGEPPCVWVYRLSAPNWQQAVLTSDGMFSVVSDYGNYAYSWINWGRGDFRRFFAKLNGGYLLGKIAGGRDVYDQEATVKSVRKVLATSYWDGTFSKSEMRQVLAALRETEFSNAEGVQELGVEVIDMDDGTSEEISVILGGELAAVYGYSSDAKHYAELLRPALQEVIRAQLEAEENKA